MGESRTAHIAARGVVKFFGVVALVGSLCAFVIVSSVAAPIPPDVKKAVAFVFMR